MGTLWERFGNFNKELCTSEILVSRVFVRVCKEGAEGYFIESVHCAEICSNKKAQNIDIFEPKTLKCVL